MERLNLQIWNNYIPFQIILTGICNNTLCMSIYLHFEYLFNIFYIYLYDI